MKELSSALRPLKNRLMLEKILNQVVTGLTIGIFVDVLLIAASKVTLINNALFLIFPVMGVSIYLALSIIKRPTMEDTAKKGDALGFKERFVTAYELCKIENGSALAAFVIKDACDKAFAADFNKLYKITLNQRNLKIMSALIVAAIFMAFVPTPAAERLAEQSSIRDKIKEEIKNINEAKKSINKKELNPEINRLIKELKTAKTEGEALKAIAGAEQRLKKISKQYISKDLMAIGEKLSQNNSTRHLGEKLKTGDISKIKEEVDRLKKSIENMSDEQLEMLVDGFREAAEQALEDKQLSELLDELGETLSDTSLSGISDSLSEFSAAIENLANENADLREAVETLNEAIEKSRSNLDSEPGGSKQSSQNGEGQQAGQSEGQGEQGQGQMQTQQSQESQGQGEGRGQGHIDNENIYSRKAIDYADYEAGVKGAENSGGNMEEAEQKGVGNAGVSIPYDRVYNSYKREALTSLNEDNIPYGLKDIVREYFSSLE